MKKIYILSLIALMCSCKHEEVKIEPQQCSIYKATKFQYNGHSYIMFETKGVSFRESGIVHDPDCECFQEPSDAEYAMGYEDGLKDKNDIQ